uniref:Fimbrial assembly family protein n=1 Tax=Thermodesulfobacterium geofontis TaxID=1295609 RepID=A0A7V5XFC5_9BACT
MIIKFNLLPKKEPIRVEEEKERFVFLKTFLIIFLVVIITILAEGIRLQYSFKNLRNEKVEKEKKLVEYKKIAEKLKELERENEELKKRISTIIALKENQGKGLQRIDTLIGNIGKNKIVFTELSVEISKADMSGVSSDLKDIAGYLKNLESVKDIIKEVSLNKTEKKEGYIEFKAGVLF